MTINNPHISIVSPVYGCKTCLWELYFRIDKSLKEITGNWELILVNDASPDGAWETIVEIATKDSRIKAIDLSRNFGQHYAITAGLDHAKGDWVVVMDCDLQDQPEEIPKLYSKAQEGYDIVLARRENRKDSLFKRLSSKIFYVIYQYLSGLKTDSTIANFGIYSAKVIGEFSKMKEVARSFPSLVQCLGFKHSSVNVVHSQRFEGKTSYSLNKLIDLSMDVILSNSNKPLKLTVKLGFIISFFSFCIAIYNIIAHIIGTIKVVGFTTTVFSIWFMGGLILLVLGIVGLYIGKIFDQVKARPLYIINNRKNL